jgi:hypothetical protein
MTAKEKAIELFNKYADEMNFDDTYRGYKQQSKQCALIAVDEILKITWVDKFLTVEEYWNEVKQQIKEL